jgi:hypothetical protein
MQQPPVADKQESRAKRAFFSCNLLTMLSTVNQRETLYYCKAANEKQIWR